MIKLFDPRKIIKIALPSFPESEIEIYDTLLANQMLKVQDLQTDSEKGLAVLKYFIKSWNFVDENEKPLEITIENIGLLPVKDFTFLMDEVSSSMDFLGKKKEKNSNA